MAMITRCLFGWPLLVLIAVALPHDQVYGADRAKPWHVLMPRDRAVYSILKEPVSYDDFVDKPLNSVLRRFGELAGLPVIPNEVEIHNSGIRLDEPINMEGSKVPLDQALVRILEPLGLEYHVDDGMLKVTTVRDPAPRLRAYDVSRLLGDGRTAKHLAEMLRGVLADREPNEAPEINIGSFGKLVVVRAPLRRHHQVVQVLNLLETGLNGGAE